MKSDIIRRFISYVKVNTQSDENSSSCPSTSGQLELGKQLVKELKEMGMQDAGMDENGYVMATLPANTEKQIPVIGFLAHVDTATDFTGNGVKPQVIEDYSGEDIVLNAKPHIVLSPTEFPSLKDYKGQTLITTDGTTLLGADDKAGVAEIMTAMDYLLKNPDIEHGKIRVAFTPDEEIGRGPHKFDVDAFGAAFAYTMDGSRLGELQYESFNAAAAKVVFKGKNIHPGTAKNIMVNSQKLAMAFHTKLPSGEAPEHTEGYEGFYHLLSFEGEVEKTELSYIIRDFDKVRFAERKKRMEKAAEEINETYGVGSVELEMRDQYFNMREKIEPMKEIVDLAAEAMKRLDIQPDISPIRGGTDGSQLSYMGLPCPNIFTGGENFHGPYEFASADQMEKAVRTIIEIVRLSAEQHEQLQAAVSKAGK